MSLASLVRASLLLSYLHPLLTHYNTSWEFLVKGFPKIVAHNVYMISYLTIHNKNTILYSTWTVSNNFLWMNCILTQLKLFQKQIYFIYTRHSLEKKCARWYIWLSVIPVDFAIGEYGWGNLIKIVYLKLKVCDKSSQRDTPYTQRSLCRFHFHWNTIYT